MTFFTLTSTTCKAFTHDGRLTDSSHSDDAVGYVDLTNGAPVVHVDGTAFSASCVKNLLGKHAINKYTKVMNYQNKKYLGTVEIFTTECSLTWKSHLRYSGCLYVSLESKGHLVELSHNGWESDGESKSFTFVVEIDGNPINGNYYPIEIKNPNRDELSKSIAEYIRPVKINSEDLDVLSMAILKEWVRTYSSWTAEEMYYGI